MDLRINIQTNKELSANSLKDICHLKNQHWTYGIENQIEWITNNILQEDFHLMLYEKKLLVAYANLVHRKVILDDHINLPVLGIGNVCVEKTRQGKGTGRILMSAFNNFLIEKHITGILLCQDKLINFYKKGGWNSVKKFDIERHQQKLAVNLMSYNLKLRFNILELEGPLF